MPIGDYNYLQCSELRTFKFSSHTRNFNGISFNLLTFKLNNIAFDKSREIIGVQCKYLRAAEGMIEGQKHFNLWKHSIRI